jgi:uncharacterized protein
VTQSICYNLAIVNLSASSIIGLFRLFPLASLAGHTVLRYNVSLLLKPEVGAAMDLAIDEVNQSLGDLKLDYVRGQLRLTRVTNRILVKGNLQTVADAECTRCLTAFKLNLNLPMEEMFALSPAGDPIYFVNDDGWLNLQAPLREQVLLAMPIKLFCRPDCKGLCPECGQNWNDGPCEHQGQQIDPRLAALKSLLP